MQVGGRVSLNKGHMCGSSRGHCIWAQRPLCLELRTYKWVYHWWSWEFFRITQEIQISPPNANSARMAQMTQAPPPWMDKQGWVSSKFARGPRGSNLKEVACLRIWLYFIIYSCPWYLLDDVYFYFNKRNLLMINSKYALSVAEDQPATPKLLWN